MLGNRERQGGEGSESWKYINVMASKAKVSNTFCGNTDVCVVVEATSSLMKTSCTLTMESFSKDRQCIDIKATVTKHKDIIPHISAAHALSGCYAVAQC